jgi:replicative DNA helicase
MQQSEALQEPSSGRTLVPPHSVEAEQAVLGGLIVDNRMGERVFDIVGPSDFYRNDHSLIFSVIQDLASADIPFDAVTIFDQLESRKVAEASGGLDYLQELSKNTVSTANIRAYAQVIRERSILRKIIGVCGDIERSAMIPDGRSSGEILDQAERSILTVAESRPKGGGPVPMATLLSQAVSKINDLSASDSSLVGISTSFSDLDRMTLGLQAADLIIVAGRPSMGKTTFAMNMVEFNVLTSESNTVVFSLEMPGESLMLRMLSSIGRIDQTKLRSGKLDDEDWPKLAYAVGQLRDKRLFIDDTSSISPNEMRSRARRIQREHGEIGLIMVDYLQLMQVPGMAGNRTSEVSEISRSLKRLAKEFNCPVVALSQLNRSLESRDNKRPINSDLRESGAIEQDADVIMFIYRDEVYHPETEMKGIAEVIIGKSRNGEIGTSYVAFIGKYTRFENYSGAMPEID